MGSLKAGDGTCTADVKIPDSVSILYDEMVSNRRHFHAYPEFSFKEFETSKKVVELLRSYGIVDIKEKVGQTGVVAMIYGEAGEGPCVALRADMDALPLPETADVSEA